MAARAARRGPYLLVVPLAGVLCLFVAVPIVMLVVVSFLDYDSAHIIWRFVVGN